MDATVYKQRTNAIKQAMQDALNTRGCNRQHDALVTVITDAVELHKDATTDPEYVGAKAIVKDVDASIKDASSVLKDAMNMLGLSKFECEYGTASFTNNKKVNLVGAFEDNKTLIRDNIVELLGACDVDLDALPEGRLKTVLKAYTTTTPGALRQKH